MNAFFFVYKKNSIISEIASCRVSVSLQKGLSIKESLIRIIDKIKELLDIELSVQKIARKQDTEIILP